MDPLFRKMRVVLASTFRIVVPKRFFPYCQHRPCAVEPSIEQPYRFLWADPPTPSGWNLLLSVVKMPDTAQPSPPAALPEGEGRFVVHMGCHPFARDSVSRHATGSRLDSMIFTATPTFPSWCSSRTMFPRHLNLICPPGVSKSTARFIGLPMAKEASVSKNIPDALTSRVTPVAPPKSTANEARTRSSPLRFCSSPFTGNRSWVWGDTTLLRKCAHGSKTLFLIGQTNY